MPNTKPIVIGAIYRPPKQTIFIEILDENLPKLDTIKVDTCVLDNFNVNMWQNVNMFSKTTSCFYTTQS